MEHFVRRILNGAPDVFVQDSYKRTAFFGLIVDVLIC